MVFFVDGIGTTPLIELYLHAFEFAAILDKAGVRITTPPGRPVHHQPGHDPVLGHAAAPTTSCCGYGPPGEHARAARDAEWLTY